MIGGDRLQASRRKTDHHNPALERDAFGRPVEDVPPDRVIDDVGALAAGGRPYLGNEILMAVVDRQVGSHFTADGQLRLRTCGRDDSSARGFGKLDRGRSNSACAPVNEHHLAALQVRPPVEPEPTSPAWLVTTT